MWIIHPFTVYSAKGEHVTQSRFFLTHLYHDSNSHEYQCKLGSACSNSSYSGSHVNAHDRPPYDAPLTRFSNSVPTSLLYLFLFLSFPPPSHNIFYTHTYMRKRFLSSSFPHSIPLIFFPTKVSSLMLRLVAHAASNLPTVHRRTI